MEGKIEKEARTVGKKGKKNMTGVVEKVADIEKKKRKKKLKKAIRRAVCAVCGGALMLGLGYFLGVHHRVIAAYIKGEKPPKAPKGHFCH